MYEELYILITDNLIKEKLHILPFLSHTLEMGNECSCQVRL